MTYITVKQSPMYRQMTLDELLFGTESRSQLINDNTTNTRTYEVEKVSDKFLKQVDIAKLITKLVEFNISVEELRKIPRRDLYHTFYIPKKSGGLRRIDAPKPELMNALYRLKTIFEEDFGALYHTSAFAYIKQRGILNCMKRHQSNESRWFAKYDLSNFFGSTTLDYTVSMLSMIFPFSEVIKHSAGKNSLEQALELAFLDGKLPQGTPFSPLLTNIIMIPIDYKLTNGLRKFKQFNQEERATIIPTLVGGNTILDVNSVDKTNSLYFSGSEFRRGYKFLEDETVLISLTFDVVGEGTGEIKTIIEKIVSTQLGSSNKDVPIKNYTLTDVTKVIGETVSSTEESETLTQEPAENSTTVLSGEAIINGQRVNVGDKITYTACLKVDELVAALEAHVDFTGGVLKLSGEINDANLLYTRYADDFQVSSRYMFEFREAEKFIADTLKFFGAPFKIKAAKTRYGSCTGSNWNLGLMLNKDNEITVGYKKKRRFQAMISSYVMDKKNGREWNKSDIQTMEGYRNYYRMIEGERIDKIVEHIGNKFDVDIVNLIKQDLAA